MSPKRRSSFATDLVGRLLFPKLPSHARKQHMRFLYLSLFLGLMCAAAFGGMLLLMYHLGHA